MNRVLKRIVLIILAVIAAIPLYIVLSGNTYMFFMLKHTVLQGRLGPTINEHVYYPNNVVEASKMPFVWPTAMDYNTHILSEEDEEYHQKYQSVAFLVIHKDSLVHEQYWDGTSDTSRTNSWSMVKSMVGHLTGCALKDGFIDDIDDPIGKYVKEYEGDTVTIRNLLSMSSGYDFYESYINPYGFTARALYGDDLKSVLARYELKDPSGQAFNYKSGNTQLLSMVVSNAVGKSISAYASDKLWKPIGAKRDALWSTDEQGLEIGFCCLNTNARDYAKFGRLYLNGGVVGQDTLVEPWYYKLITKPSEVPLETGAPNDRYGYHWWCSRYEGENFFYAHGINGQYILILPDSDLIVVRLGQKRPSERLNGQPVDIYEYIRMAKQMVSDM